MSNDREERFERHSLEWRDPLAIASQWSNAAALEPGLFAVEAGGNFWDLIEQLAITLIVTREYEHLLLALATVDGAPRISYMRLPHPSGLAFDAERGVLHCASTRNPNQLYEFAPVAGMLDRRDDERADTDYRPLVPLRTHYLPGCFYIHDLAIIGSGLHANSVGQNVIVRADDRGASIVWWPLCVDIDGKPDTGRNLIQLNSIAAGETIETSYFSASGERPGTLMPGHPEYPVNRRGVVFSGATREPVIRGLTRPHSARLHSGQIWVDNSGYGELVVSNGYGSTVVTRLPGWTRGLAFASDVVFVGTSRVIPRFRQYAPGLNVDISECAIHIVQSTSGKVLGSLVFPTGNQIFAIEAVPATWSRGFPFLVNGRDIVSERRLFYAYTT